MLQLLVTHQATDWCAQGFHVLWDVLVQQHGALAIREIERHVSDYGTSPAPAAREQWHTHKEGYHTRGRLRNGAMAARMTLPRERLSRLV